MQFTLLSIVKLKICVAPAQFAFNAFKVVGPVKNSKFVADNVVQENGVIYDKNSVYGSQAIPEARYFVEIENAVAAAVIKEVFTGEP